MECYFLWIVSKILEACSREFSINILEVSIPQQTTPARKIFFTLLSNVSTSYWGISKSLPIKLILIGIILRKGWKESHVCYPCGSCRELYHQFAYINKLLCFYLLLSLP